MRIDDNIMNLISVLEYCIGKECYNPNTLKKFIDENHFRYPIHYRLDKDFPEDTSKDHLPSDISPECFNNIKYLFGANELRVGRGIIRALSMMEMRYNIDFNALEHKYLENKEPKELEDGIKREEQGENIIDVLIEDGYSIKEYHNKSTMFCAYATKDKIRTVIQYYGGNGIGINEIDHIKKQDCQICFFGEQANEWIVISDKQIENDIVNYAEKNDVIVTNYYTVMRNGVSHLKLLHKLRDNSISIDDILKKIDINR